MRLLTLLLWALPLLSFGQGFGGGLYGGISTTQASGDQIVGFHKVGGWGGAFTDYRFTPRSTLQLELSFIQKGGRQTPTDKNNNTLILHNLNMLEIPVLYRWYGIKNMSVEIGMQAGILLSSLDKRTGAEFFEKRNSSLYRRGEWSGAAGVSYYFWKGKVEANVRYSNSILSMKKGYWWMNHVFAFSVRYWFKTTLDKDRIEASKKKDRIEVKVE